MILIFIVIFSINYASASKWQRQCAACRFEDAECQMKLVDNREIAEIRLEKVPEEEFWLNGCDGVDVLHIDFKLNSIDSKLMVGNLGVDTLILSNVSSVARKTLSSIERSNANSIIFCNLQELGAEIPNVGRLAFTGTLDESALSLFSKGPVANDDSMSIIFTPTFSGLIDSPLREIPQNIESLLLKVTSSDQFLLVTENIVRLKHKPIINVILDTNDDEDAYLATHEFVQRIAQLASAVEIRKRGYESQGFSQASLPRFLIVNLARFMSITYFQIRKLPESSELKIFFQADYKLEEYLRKVRGVYCKTHEAGFRCRINVKELFEGCQLQHVGTKGNEFDSYVGIEASRFSSREFQNMVENINPNREEAINNPNRLPTGQKSLPISNSRVLADQTNRVPIGKNTVSSKTKTSDQQNNSEVQKKLTVDVKSAGHQEDVATGRDAGKTLYKTDLGEISESAALSSEDPDSEPRNGSPNMSTNKFAKNQGFGHSGREDQHSQDINETANAHTVAALHEDHPTDSSEQATSLSEMQLPQQEIAAVGDDTKSSKSGALDSPVVMISIIAGSIIVLTVALIVIFVSSKRRRLKRSTKLQSPASSKNETDPETLWW